MSTMPAQPRSLIIEATELGPVGQELGTGGQAVVWTLRGPRQQQVLKRYKPGIDVEADALDALISWRNGLTQDAQQFVDDYACWPLQRVVDGGLTVGVVMNRAPERFSDLTADGRRRLRELQHLFLVERMRKLGADVPEPVDRARVVGQLANLLDFLASHQVVHGDLSMKNILWEPPQGDRPAVYLLDCDGARIGDKPSPLPNVTTPNWTDPRMTRGDITAHDAASDLYALALSFYRCYYGHQGELDEESTKMRVPEWPPTSPGLLQLTASGLSHKAGRPSASAWVVAVKTLIADLEDPGTDLGRAYLDAPVVTKDERATNAGLLPDKPGRKRDAKPKPQTGKVAPTERSRRALQAAVLTGLAAGAVIAFLIITVFLS